MKSLLTDPVQLNLKRMEAQKIKKLQNCCGEEKKWIAARET